MHQRENGWSSISPWLSKIASANSANVAKQFNSWYRNIDFKSKRQPGLVYTCQLYVKSARNKDSIDDNQPTLVHKIFIRETSTRGLPSDGKHHIHLFTCVPCSTVHTEYRAYASGENCFWLHISTHKDAHTDRSTGMENFPALSQPS